VRRAIGCSHAPEAVPVGGKQITSLTTERTVVSTYSRQCLSLSKSCDSRPIQSQGLDRLNSLNLKRLDRLKSTKKLILRLGPSRMKPETSRPDKTDPSVLHISPVCHGIALHRDFAGRMLIEYLWMTTSLIAEVHVIGPLVLAVNALRVRKQYKYIVIKSHIAREQTLGGFKSTCSMT
jgi:hypothetical protein